MSTQTDTRAGSGSGSAKREGIVLVFSHEQRNKIRQNGR